MASKLMNTMRKPVASLLAILLAFLLVPVIPATPTSAVAAPGADSETNLKDGVSITYDSHPAKGEDGTGKLDISKTQIDGLDPNPDKPSLTYNGTSDNDTAFTKSVNDAIDKLQLENTGKTVELVENSAQASYGDTKKDASLALYTDDAHTTSSTDITVAEGSSYENGWTLSTNTTATAYAQVTYAYTYTYTINFSYTLTDKESAGTDEDASGDTSDKDNPDQNTDPDSNTEPATPPSSQPETKTYTGTENCTATATATGSFTVTSADRWAGLDSAIAAFSGDKAPQISLSYNGKNATPDKKTIDLIEGYEGLTCEISGLNSKPKKRNIKVSDPVYSDTKYTVDVEAIKATKEKPDTFTIEFKYPDGQDAGSIDVSVTVGKKTATVALELDFRMAADQKAEIINQINAQVNEQTEGQVTDYLESDSFDKEGGSTFDESSYYTEVSSLAGEDTLDLLDKSIVAFTPKASGTTADEDDIRDSYDVTVKSIKVKTVGDESWAGSDLILKGSGLGGEQTITSDNAGATWIRNIPSASIEGKQISQANVEKSDLSTLEFSDTSLFSKDGTSVVSGGQGKQTGWFYVQDPASKIVSKISGVNYLHDSVAPALSAFDAVPQGKDFKSSDSQVWAAENMDVTFIATEGIQVTDTASGMSAVDISYTEAASGQSGQSKSLDGKQYVSDDINYTFSISADSEVSTDSIKVSMTDNAGNESGELGYKDTKTNIEVAKLVAETTAPTIIAAWDTIDAKNGSYYKTNRTLTLTVTAPFFEYTQEYMGDFTVATIYKEGAATNRITPSDFTNTATDTWVAKFYFTEDADWEVSTIQITDVLSRTDSVSGESFTIDKTMPTIQVSFDNNNVSNGMYYNAARTATITVNEHNFSSSLVRITPTSNAGNGTEVTEPVVSGWSSNGDVHTATVNFPGQGVYAMSVSGTDLAENAMSNYSCDEFVVDTIAPEISVSGIEKDSAYKDDAQPQVSLSDTNIDSASTITLERIDVNAQASSPYAESRTDATTTIDVSYNNPEAVAENDGVYQLIIQAQDLAGNTSDEAYAWSINRFGSTYVLLDNTSSLVNQYLPYERMSNVKVMEINPSGLKDGETSVNLTKGTANSTLKEGTNYQVEPETSNGWSTYTYTVNKDNFNSDGFYQVRFHSVDVAGNTSENTMENKNSDRTAEAKVAFTVDDTAPVCSFINLQSGSTYNESTHEAQVSVEENAKLIDVTITVNGKAQDGVSTADFDNGAKYKLSIPESNEKQTITVVATDAAGNKSETVIADGILISTDPVALWMNNTPLFVGSIVGACALVALIAWLIVLAAKKRGEKQAA